jgi:2-polyprenyl-6-methoxyphenol hydroxylase-like FAD-dependent oxidoreductase
MKHTDVLIVGAGPTGLTLAASLLIKGVSVTLVDRQSEGANTSRAAGVNARTLEVLDGLDVTRRLRKEGIEAPRFVIRDGARVLLKIDFSGLTTDYPFTLLCPQSTTERLLLDRVRELGGDVTRPKVLTTITPTGSPRGSPTATPSGRSTSSAPTGCTAPSANRRGSVSPVAHTNTRSCSPTRD